MVAVHPGTGLILLLRRRFRRPRVDWQSDPVVDPIRLRFARRPVWPSPGVLGDRR
ncbi:hypothetical protein SAMN04489835_0673 [Mycolicibacterium rutilum]|uniref:Uncharacterized protein n=1 Tax=Mycolicibacterium rutilum TaxID=370526 RepID=A0A1H6IPG0_MYCRU|nr:hypothetical protein SAMN04489835_0673 [Mycolicibacterium rutilum]